MGKTELEREEVFNKLAKEWNYEKNGEADIWDYSYSSNFKAWWKCEKEHEWKTTIRNRFAGSKCPYCSGNKVIKGETDLASKNARLAKEWDSTKWYINSRRGIYFKWKKGMVEM